MVNGEYQIKIYFKFEKELVMRKVYENLYSEQGKNGKYALFLGTVGNKKEKKRISEWKYDRVWKNDVSIFAIVDNNFYVLIDKKTGKELTPDNEYTFISNPHFGIRSCKNIYKKSAILINNKVVSPWYDNIRFEPVCNVVTINGVEFMTTGDGCTRIAGPFAKIGKFSKPNEYMGYYAKAIGINGKIGTIDGAGNTCIPCMNDALYSLGTVFKISQTRSEKGNNWYGLYAINGELITKEYFIDFKLWHGKVEFISVDGESVFYNTLGERIKN